MSSSRQLSEASFTASRSDRVIIRAIVERAATLLASHGQRTSKHDDISMEMDLLACHANGSPLRLTDLLAADDFNFAHDVFGIGRHIDRTTGRLTDCFSPRFSARVEARAA